MNGLEQLDDALPAWNEIRDRDWASLLLGNGFSQNVWHRFEYASLFETAKSDDIEHPLTADDLNLFARLETRNFEVLLSALSTGITVTEALGREAGFLVERYESIRQALVGAVHHVHLAWNAFPEEHARRIAGYLAQFEFVYSTNYDLLTYWAVMQSMEPFKDYFWARAFDIADTEIWGKCTKILYLHGGLQLYRRPNGQTLKRAAEAGQNLLDLFATDYEDAVPLFVTEGTAEEKKASIYRSEYLAFAFSQFSQDKGPLVIFGHSLSEVDRHLTDVLRNHGDRTIAVSIRREAGSVRERKAQIIATLPDAHLTFFDAKTCPLGADDLRTEDDQE